MAFYLAPYTIDWDLEQVLVDAGALNVLCRDLWIACRAAQATREGIGYEPIASGSGLTSLGPGVATGLTVEFLGDWQLKFPEGNYIARVAGGNLVGGPGGDPIAYSAGVQALLIQSASGTVIDPSTPVPSAAQNAAATVAAIQQTTVPVNASAIADAVWAEVIEAGLSADDLLRIALAALAGTSQKVGNTITFKGVDGVTDRITGSFDADNNRTGAVLDGS